MKIPPCLNQSLSAGTASSPRPRTRGTGIAEGPAERATAEARQPSQDRVPRHLTSSLDDRHLPTYAPTLMHEASKNWIMWQSL